MSAQGPSNGGVKRKAPPRKASPTRPENEGTESTFTSKLAEIKKMRSTGVAHTNSVPPVKRAAMTREEPVVPKQVKTANGVKTFLKSFEHWIEVVSGSGKIYYYNKKTQENQWKKPQAWIDEEMRLNPPIPPEPVIPPAPFVPEEVPLPPGPEPPKVTMKIKTKKKVNKVKKKVSKLPAAYQVKSEEDLKKENGENSNEKETVESAFETFEEETKKPSLVKLEKKDEIGHIDIKLETNGVTKEEKKVDVKEEEKKDVKKEEEKKDVKQDEKDVKPEVKREEARQKFNAETSLPGMERIRKGGSAALQAYQNLSKIPESKLMDVDPSPAAKLTGNTTYFGVFNISCCLRRCKFPKEQDVLNELRMNKMKKRNYCPLPLYDNPELARIADEAELEQFYAELKDYHNHDSLLTAKLGGKYVYKIIDEVWDRYFHKFQIKIFDGLFLECRPSGYTQADEPVFSRTGKKCAYEPFPEDWARCQAILQAWKKDYCIVIYANKEFKIKRDDREWRRDLDEIRNFLDKHGY